MLVPPPLKLFDGGGLSLVVRGEDLVLQGPRAPELLASVGSGFAWLALPVHRVLDAEVAQSADGAWVRIAGVFRDLSAKTDDVWIGPLPEHAERLVERVRSVLKLPRAIRDVTEEMLRAFPPELDRAWVRCRGIWTVSLEQSVFAKAWLSAPQTPAWGHYTATVEGVFLCARTDAWRTDRSQGYGHFGLYPSMLLARSIA